MNLNTLRKWNRNIHRDLGYLSVGLTLIYAISGIAVNHVQDWNPSYRITHLSGQISPVDPDTPVNADLARKILRQLEMPLQFKSFFRPAPETLKIFTEGNTITVHLPDGRVEQELVNTRTGLYEMNFLHLNHPKKAWTWFADLYAIALALLAVSGLFILKGKKGLKGRGGWLTAAGILLPIFFIWLYR